MGLVSIKISSYQHTQGEINKLRCFITHWCEFFKDQIILVFDCEESVLKMPAKVDLVSDAKHKQGGEVTALCFDGEHLYSGSEDGVINVRIFFWTFHILKEKNDEDLSSVQNDLEFFRWLT